jgi:hypothetical protein
MKKLSLIVLLALLPATANAFSTDDLLALIAMPLAVAAVSDITGVPAADLSSLVATLNNANVPPVQEVQILRYVPVALVEQRTETTFVDFVQQQVAQGITGDALVPVVFERLRTYDVQPAPAPGSSVIVVDDTFIPAEVRTRVTTLRAHPTHPHGGPPGQLKKIVGVQTGAEIVHAGGPVHIKKVHVKKDERVVLAPMTSAAPAPAFIPPGQARKMEGGGSPGEAKEHGHGKGKGHGKD